MSEIQLLRRHYAEGIALTAGFSAGPLLDAFASVPRERFLGPGPWQIMNEGGYRQTPDADPRHVYHDLLVALVPKRRLNNGRPSFLATLIHTSRLCPGEHVVHLGCGVGYYTAVMAETVGRGGRVTAIEADEALATRAVENLAGRENVEVRRDDGLTAVFEPPDVVLVNFGMTHPLRSWVERLAPGGRLLVPLTAATGVGMFVMFERIGERVAARGISPTRIFSSVSGRDATLEARLAERFAAGPTAAAVVNSLRLDEHQEDESCWLHAAEVCLSTQGLEPAGPLGAYAGTFRAGRGIDVVFRVEGKVLHVQSPAGHAELVQLGEDRFEAPNTARFAFARDADGRVSSVTIVFGDQTFEAPRV